MNSIGIYVPKKDNKINVELQINLWNITGDKKQKNAIDIAIRCPKDIDDIYLALPFKADKKSFSDLGTLLSENENVLKTVFNDNTRVIDESKKSMIKVVQRDNDSSKQFFLRMLSDSCFEDAFERNEKKEKEENEEIIGYSLFKIHTGGNIELNNNYDKVTDVYVRFRINIPSISTFAYEEEMSNDFIQSNFSSSLLFDFRINDLRAIHDNIISKMNNLNSKYELCGFNKIQFFYMLDKEEEFSCGKMYNSSRLLESAKWQAYFPKIDKEKRYIAYYWKEEKNNTEYSLFFKTNFSKPRYCRIIFYVLFLIIFGALGSLLFSVSQKISSSLFSEKFNEWEVEYLFPLILIVVSAIIIKLVEALWEWIKKYINK